MLRASLRQGSQYTRWTCAVSVHTIVSQSTFMHLLSAGTLKFCCQVSPGMLPLEQGQVPLEAVQRDDVHHQRPYLHVYLSCHPLQQTARHVDVVSEEANEVTGPDEVGHVELALTPHEVVPEGAGHALVLERSSEILGEPDGQVCLPRVRLSTQQVDEVVKTPVVKPDPCVDEGIITRLLWPHPLRVGVGELAPDKVVLVSS